MSLQDINYLYYNVDVGILRSWIERKRKRDNDRRLIFKLDMADVINAAYIGSQPVEKGKVNNNIRNFRKWQEKIYRILYPDAYDNRPSFWDMMKKRGRSLKVN